MALVQKLLHLLELFIKLFLPNLSNITLFNHFNNFCLRVLLTKEIPYFYLKSEVVQHLMRIFSGDQIENIFLDADVIKSKMPMVWIEPMKGLGLDKEA